jgi:cardiolipin synthase
MRGVQIDILIPENNNLKLVHWASMAQLWQILSWRCRIWLIPPPFDHSKLMVVDNGWSLIGSSNMDPRSLRLNFEFNVECYCENFAKKLTQLLNQKIQKAKQLTLFDVNHRPFLIKLRDGFVRLFEPYL